MIHRRSLDCAICTFSSSSSSSINASINASIVGTVSIIGSSVYPNKNIVVVITTPDLNPTN